jgi:hypothetical protein
MQSFSSFLRETFTDVYPWQLRTQLNDYVKYEFTAEGKNVTVDFSSAQRNALPQHEVDLSFFVNNEHKITGLGQGVKFKILSTVLDCTRDYIVKFKPARIHFTSSKFESYEKSSSRSSLYTKLIQRFASASGYELETVQSRPLTDTFILRRIQK